MRSLMLAPCIALLVGVVYSQQNDVRYVKANHSQNCPDQPCHDLEYYASRGAMYFTTGSTFVFLPGNHSIHSSILLQNVSDVLFKGDSDVIVICKVPTDIIVCKNVTNFGIESVIFMLYTRNTSKWIPVFNISDSREILLQNLTFQGSSDAFNALVGAAYITHSQALIQRCVFDGNMGLFGGALHVLGGSNITLAGNLFSNNEAKCSGGAIFVTESFLLLKYAMGNNFTHNSAVAEGGALVSLNSTIGTDVNAANFSLADFDCSNISSGMSMHRVSCGTHFSNNKAKDGGAVYLKRSVMSLSNIPVLVFHNNSAESGGAISSVYSKVFLSSGCFTWNSAKKDGGACYGYGGILAITNINHTLEFGNNHALFGMGGAIYQELGELCITGSALFLNNSAENDFGGGAMLINRTNTTFNGDAGQGISFLHNHANDKSTHDGAGGGGIAAFGSNLTITNRNVSFVKNSAHLIGGGLLMTESSVLVVKSRLSFTHNYAYGGAGLYCNDSIGRLRAASYVNNYGKFGGGAFSAVMCNLLHHDANITGNYEIAIHLLKSNASFSGNVNVSSNIGWDGGIRGINTGGGAIRAMVASIYFTGSTVFEDNFSALNGGAITLLLQSTISFSGVVLFRNNSAAINGGAIFATDSAISLNNATINFTSNSAQKDGGALYFQDGATINIQAATKLTTNFNQAAKYGGAIYHSDAVTSTQCELTNQNQVEDNALTLPKCFIDLIVVVGHIPLTLASINDSAGYDGNFLYGGLLDKCQVLVYHNTGHLNVSLFYTQIILNPNVSMIESEHTGASRAIASEPYVLCFCESDSKYNCSEMRSVVTFRGRTFTASLLALSQGNTLSSTNLRVKLSTTARLRAYQTLQFLPHKCTHLSYNLYSSKDQEQLIVYPDGGSCRDTGAAHKTINVTFLPCPDAFTLSDDKCTCDEKLQAYGAECTLFDDGIYITRKSGSLFWISPLYANESYQGLISYPNCPLGYCKTDSINISLLQPDVQCDFNRSKTLCGACAANYSLTFGSSKCQLCSNSYLLLVLIFAAAGIVLVIFLILLKLTVATGMINSVILYANVVQANKTLLFPTSTTSATLLSVFISWMNLDAGFNTCFYHGMDAYTKTWLQFAFPIYVWFLIILMICTSRSSVRVTKLLGSNPIAVLATLILMSYAKVLRIIIAVYSFVELQYPGNVTKTVWLIDANVSYLQSWHLALTVVTTLILALLFLPYTFLLLFGYKLYRVMPARLRIVMGPFLDSYYAPYKANTRYWPGFLLLVRCALYIIICFDSVGHTSRSLFPIVIVFAAIIALLSARIYIIFYKNAMEALVYLNLIVLAAAASNGVNSPALVESLIGMVLAIMTGIALYQFHVLYIGKTHLWTRLLEKLKKSKKDSEISERAPLMSNPVHTSSAPTHSVFCLPRQSSRDSALDLFVSLPKQDD